MKELLTRSVTGLVYGLLMVGSLLLHPLAFLLVYLSVTVLSMNEFLTLSRREGLKPLRLPALIMIASAFIIGFFHRYADLSSIYFIILPAMIICLYIIELFRKGDKPFLNLAMIFMGLIYIGLPLTLINELFYNPYTIGYSAELLIFFFMVLWLNDTGAYLVGSLIGRTKLAERISPKKTWEGLIGGLLFAFLVTGLFGRFFIDIPRFDQWVITGIIVIFGTLGDLLESVWKRSLGIKDTGKILPGHGGWLDRLDSILLAVPAVYITITILNAG